MLRTSCVRWESLAARHGALVVAMVHHATCLVARVRCDQKDVDRSAVPASAPAYLLPRQIPSDALRSHVDVSLLIRLFSCHVWHCCHCWLLRWKNQWWFYREVLFCSPIGL